MSRESMHYDVLIVGAGPAGLAAAIRLKQLNAACSVCVVEKASEVGGHILSGAVFETRALDELLPDWRILGAPVQCSVSSEHFCFLSKKKSYRVPEWLLPKALRNHGNYVISLANLCRFLAKQASMLGVEIYPGFAASEVLFNETQQVIGVVTGDMGVSKDGDKKPEYLPGIALHAQYTLFAEGCRGYLTQQLIHAYGLCKNSAPQTYGLGIKEIWQVDPAKHRPGLVMHTAGWPLNHDVYGGGFVYHLDQHQVAVGFVLGLDYRNTFLDPFEEMQRFKTHPKIAPLFAQGKRLAYGARVLNEGGFQSIPELIFPGGLLIGCSAGFLNVAKAKGSHTAMKSGMLAAECVISALADRIPLVIDYPMALKKSWVYAELKQTRNFRAWFRLGLKMGALMAGLELRLPRWLVRWTVPQRGHDRNVTQPAALCQPIDYPKPDGKLSFDRMSSVYLANIRHEENQPVHLKIKDPSQFAQNLKMYAAPEQRYCPAGVYEVIADQLQINAANCVQCKACDIKDPYQNITWTVAEGGSGPNYQDM